MANMDLSDYVCVDLGIAVPYPKKAYPSQENFNLRHNLRTVSEKLCVSKKYYACVADYLFDWQYVVDKGVIYINRNGFESHPGVLPKHIARELRRTPNP